MKTRILELSETAEAVSLLRNGEVVAIPTETVYGLAADATNDDAVRKIFAAKGRPSDHPLIVHIGSFDDVYDWAESLPEGAAQLAKAFWPGPLTMIFRKKTTVSDLITGGLNTVALRVPSHPVARNLIQTLGKGVAAPSANAHKKTSPTKPEHVLKTLEGKIAGVVNGGACTVGIESTILDLTKETPAILRPGVLSSKQIERVIEATVHCPFEHSEKVAGNMKVHYRPETPLYMLTKEECERVLANEKNVAVIHYSHFDQFEKARMYEISADPLKYASQLYEILHAVDTTNVEAILVEEPRPSADWVGIQDRLKKASSDPATILELLPEAARQVR